MYCCNLIVSNGVTFKIVLFLFINQKIVFSIIPFKTTQVKYNLEPCKPFKPPNYLKKLTKKTKPATNPLNYVV